jgi:hypothetical protein
MDTNKPNSFGEIDLGGDSSEEELVLDTQTETPSSPPPTEQAAPPPQAKPVEATPPPAAQAKQPEEAIQPRPARRPAASQEEEFELRRPPSKALKVSILVLVLLGLIALGAYGIWQWKKSTDAEQEAEMDHLNTISRDSLMNKAVKKESVNP